MTKDFGTKAGLYFAVNSTIALCVGVLAFWAHIDTPYNPAERPVADGSVSAAAVGFDCWGPDRTDAPTPTHVIVMHDDQIARRHGERMVDRAIAQVFGEDHELDVRLFCVPL